MVLSINFLDLFYKIMKKHKIQWMEANLNLKVLIYCIIIFMKQAWKEANHT